MAVLANADAKIAAAHIIADFSMGIFLRITTDARAIVSVRVPLFFVHGVKPA
jgi:hypothetical protein